MIVSSCWGATPSTRTTSRIESESEVLMLKFLLFFYQNDLHLDFPSRSEFRASSKRKADLRHSINLKLFNWREPALIPKLNQISQKSITNMTIYCLCPTDDSRSTEVESTRLHAFKWPFIIQGRFHLANWAHEKEQTLFFAFWLLALFINETFYHQEEKIVGY